MVKGFDLPDFADSVCKNNLEPLHRTTEIDNPLERSFYEKECEEEHWGVRELKRQMKRMLFHRLALSTDKREVMRLASEMESEFRRLMHTTENGE